MGKWFFIFTTFLLALPGCSADETPTRQNDLTLLTSIAIEAQIITLPAGTSTQLIAKGNYSGLFVRDITSQVTWSSSQPSVADFFSSSPGRVSALAPGVTTIIATLEGIPTSIDLTVSNAVLTALAVEPQRLALPLGLTQSFTAEGTFSDATKLNLTFGVTWSSSDPTVATVSNEAAGKGEVTALKQGITTISASLNGVDVTGAALLTVIDPIPLSLEVTPASLSMLSLSTQPLAATGKYSDGGIRDLSASVTWASSNATVATIAADGELTALTPGTTTISAAIEEITTTANVRVTGGLLLSIALILNPQDQVVGTSSRVTAIGTFDNETSRDITGAIASWSVSDGVKASITSNAGSNLAWVQALAVTPQAGPVKISATYGTLSSPQTDLLVSKPDLNGLSLSAAPLDLSTGTSGRLRLSGAFSPVTNQDLSPSAGWSSSIPATAAVGDLGLEKGRVVAQAAGTSVITATYGGQTATTTVTVVDRTLQSLNLIQVSLPNSMTAGTEQKFMVEALFSDGFRQDVTADATWSIDNLNVAKFSDVTADPGLVVVVDGGTAILKATFNDQSATETLITSP